MADIGFGFPSKSGIPVGVVLPFFGTDQDVPDGWLLCDGRKFSVGRYATLAAQLSRAAGGYTDTTPDLRGRIPVGKDNMGGTSANRVTGSWADSFGGASGAETHALELAELASHDHGQSVTNATGTGQEAAYYAGGGGVNEATYTRTTTLGNGSNQVRITTAAVGSGTAHNNMQPSIAMNYIIKAE